MPLHVEELAWFRQLGGAAAAVRGKICSRGKSSSPKNSASTRRGVEAWGAIMPSGFHTVPADTVLAKDSSQDPYAHLSEPIQDGDVNRLLVRRSSCGREFTLCTEDNDPLLMAKASEASAGFSISIANDARDSPLAHRPILDIEVNAARDCWTLRTSGCVGCLRDPAAPLEEEGRCDLARVAHYREDIGAGDAWCMDVDIPVGCASCCSRCNSGRGGTCESMPTTALTMRRPKWSEKRNALVLNFFGRCQLASAQNFQLKVAGDSVGNDANRVAVLFGKSGSNTYVLDVRKPLSALQAFAIALTTFDWKP